MWNCGSSPDGICCPVQRPNHITIILIQWFQIKLASHQLPFPTHPRRFLVWPRFRFRAVVFITLRRNTKPGTQEVFLLVLLDAQGMAGRIHHTFTRETFIIFWRASCTLCFSRCGYMCSWSRKTQCQFVFSYFEKGCRKSARDNPERYCELFWVHYSSMIFERMTREAMGVRLLVLKESNKTRFDSYSVRNSELIISHISFRDCREHIFSDNICSFEREEWSSQ